MSKYYNINNINELKNKKLHFIIHKKKRKKFRTNDDLFKFLDKYKDTIKNIEVYLDDYIIVKYDKI